MLLQLFAGCFCYNCPEEIHLGSRCHLVIYLFSRPFINTLNSLSPVADLCGTLWEFALLSNSYPWFSILSTATGSQQGSLSRNSFVSQELLGKVTAKKITVHKCQNPPAQAAVCTANFFQRWGGEGNEKCRNLPADGSVWRSHSWDNWRLAKKWGLHQGLRDKVPGEHLKWALWNAPITSLSLVQGQWSPLMPQRSVIPASGPLATTHWKMNPHPQTLPIMGTKKTKKENERCFQVINF